MPSGATRWRTSTGRSGRSIKVGSALAPRLAAIAGGAASRTPDPAADAGCVHAPGSLQRGAHQRRHVDRLELDRRLLAGQPDRDVEAPVLVRAP